MKVICVDDEPLAVDYTVGQCEKLLDIDEVKALQTPILPWTGFRPIPWSLRSWISICRRSMA